MGDLRYIYQNELDKACFQHDLAYWDFQDLPMLLMEVEGIIKSQPLTCQSISAVNKIIPLNPMELLRSKRRLVMPPQWRN